MPLRRYGRRLAIHPPVVTPALNPKAKKAILAAEDTSDHMDTNAAAANAKNMSDKITRTFFDFIINSTFDIL